MSASTYASSTEQKIVFIKYVCYKSFGYNQQKYGSVQYMGVLSNKCTHNN